MNLNQLLTSLLSLPKETEWVEFKHNNDNPDEIGEYLSALSNSAALHGKEGGYVVWGVEDGTHEIVGTIARPRLRKIGNEELENWLAHNLSPRVDFRFHEFDFEGHSVVSSPRSTRTGFSGSVPRNRVDSGRGREEKA